jgi:hypothetical protein
MAQGFGIPSGLTVNGIEITSLTITGKVDMVIIDPDTEKTKPTEAFCYNPTMDISVEGIDTGYQPQPTIQALNKTFQVTSSSVVNTAGDFKKVSIRGVHYPSV